MTRPLSHADARFAFENATLSIGEATPLSGFSLSLDKATPTALLGPNGSGKSTLLKALVGDPNVSLSQGSLSLDGGQISLDWAALDPESRASHGVFMAWQHPPTLLGLKQRVFLRTIVNAQRAIRQEEPLDPFDFLDLVRPCLARLGLSEDWLDRAVGEGFSGGEKKKNELLQFLLLSPQWVFCDEIEAGMDVETLQLTSRLLNEHVERGGGLLVVSHHAAFLDSLPIRRAVRLQSGRVARDVFGEQAASLWRG